MSGENSRIMPINITTEAPSDYYNPELIKSGVVASLYRVSRDGKYFIIKTAAPLSADMQTLVRREYELSLGLTHPNIVNVFTFEESTPVGPGIVMEYIDGRTLGEFLSENPSKQLRRRILDQLLDAVGYMHRKGIIHNDLKPDNILITRVDNTLKIIDFGLSDHDAYYLTHNLGCTPEYASPELLSQQVTDSRSDIYSLGLIMRQILAGGRRIIWKKASNPVKEKRYANVEQIQKALKVRKITLAIIVPIIIIAVASSFFYHQSVTNLHNTEELNVLQQKNDSLKQRLNLLEELRYHDLSKKEYIDSICQQLKQRMVTLLEPIALKLPGIEYQLELTSEFGSIGEEAVEIWKSYLEKETDIEIKDAINRTYGTTWEYYFEKYMSMVKDKPWNENVR